jgi:hypothetical protein
MLLRGITVSYQIGDNFGCKYQIRVLKIVPEGLARAPSVGVGRYVKTCVHLCCFAAHTDTFNGKGIPV